MPLSTAPKWKCLKISWTDTDILCPATWMQYLFVELKHKILHCLRRELVTYLLRYMNTYPSTV